MTFTDVLSSETAVTISSIKYQNLDRRHAAFKHKHLHLLLFQKAISVNAKKYFTAITR